MIKLLFNFLFRTKRKGLTVRAAIHTTVASARVKFCPSTALYKYMGERGEMTPEEELPPEKRSDAVWVARRVARVANRLPWENKCLVRAMVAQRLLRGYGLGSTLYLGVGRDENHAMAAHAWVRCGTLFITGGNGEGYGVVTTFAMRPKGEGG